MTSAPLALPIDATLFAKLLNDEKRRVITGSNTGEVTPRLLLTLVAAFIAARPAGNWRGAIVWAVIMVLLPGPALFWPKWFFSLPDKYFWPACTFIGGVAYPVGWSVLPLLAPVSSFDTQLILLFLVSLVVVMRARVSSYNPPEMYAQILVSLGVLTSTQVFRGAEHRWVIASCLAIMALALIAHGKSAYRQFVHVIALNVRNAQLVEQLSVANAAKTRFLAAASHDLRQPLHSAGLLVGMLESRISDVESRSIVGRVSNAISAMETLLNAILNISRLDAGVERPEVGPLPIRRIFQHLERTFRAEAVAKQLELRIRVRNLWVASDEHLLARILNNLISNSLRYTRGGGVLVAARERGDTVLIDVWDTGIGIPAERQADVFQEFVQLDNPHRDRNQGMGLGLAIVQRTAAVLGHSIDLRSRVNRGTLFRVTLPRVAVPREMPLPRSEAPLLDLAGLYILFVDDEQDVRYAMHGLLTDWGCTVVTAGNGAAALSEFSQRLRAPDALILDYRLPDDNGVALAGKLHSAAGIALPTLIVTGDVTPEPLTDIGKSGLKVMHKPVDPAILRQWLCGIKETAAIAAE